MMPYSFLCERQPVDLQLKRFLERVRNQFPELVQDVSEPLNSDGLWIIDLGKDIVIHWQASVGIGVSKNMPQDPDLCLHPDTLYAIAQHKKIEECERHALDKIQSLIQEGA